MKRLATFFLPALLALPFAGCEPNDTGGGGTTTPSTAPSDDAGTPATDRGAPGGADTTTDGATP
jgi:hypothetical protein